MLCASNPLSTQDDVAAALVEEFDISVFAIKGEDNDTYYQHIEAAVDHKPQLTMDDGADVIGVLHSHRREQLGDIIGGDRGDDDRRDPAEGPGARRRARLPGDRGQRRADEAHVRQPLRHGPVDDRRHRARDQHPPCRAHVRGRRLRLVRPRRRDAREGHGLPRGRHRGRPAARARGRDGRLPGVADGQGGAGRRHLRHRDGRQVGDHAGAHAPDEGRRDPRQHRALQRRDRDPGSAVARCRDRRRCGSSWTSSSSRTAGGSI